MELYLQGTGGSTTASIKSDNISLSHGDRQTLKNSSLEVDGNQVMCLVGPSGCGKTTLIRCLPGLNKPSIGEIWIGDRCVFSQARCISILPERRDTGVVFQDYAVWPHMTALGNVCYLMKKRRMPKAEVRQRAENVLKRVRMSEYAGYLPSQLSGGQQQRVATVRTLVSSDVVIVMDEPITNLDAKLREEMFIETRQTQKNIGITILYITHDQEASLQLCDKMTIMNREGELRQLGAGEDIILRPANRLVFEFVGVSNLFTLCRKGKDWCFSDNGGMVFDGKVPAQYEQAGIVDMGVRPNNTTFDSASPLKAAVKRSVSLGSEYDYFVDFSGKEIRVQKNVFSTNQAGMVEREGETVGLKFISPEFYPAVGKEESL